ncbi:unnamed protein product [Brassicogethes aeneus]|uniref:Uncharacterized protein n=1 Tax=Brassicogethes aeneus TaxID=1431903 RepID=A0A9P0B7Q8_BRAAE|nr:unnamed protein product [Brassicogethes aeneus]
MQFLSVFLTIFVSEVLTLDINEVPPYVKQCYEGDPKVVECFKDALLHLRPYLRNGIQEIELPSVEPFKMEELSLSLTGGPNGYKVSLKDIDIFGASNFTVQKIKLIENGQPFEGKITIPLLRINSRYTSSGVLIILPASGNGTFNGQFDDLSAYVKGKVSVHKKDNAEYLHVDSLNVDVSVRNARMAVKNIYKNNKILTAYFVKQCNKLDDDVNQCLRQSANFLVANMRNGIPEIGVEEPEPIIIDEIQLALGSGPDGYRAVFKNIKAYGVSNVTVTNVRSDIDTNQFQITMYIPKISARAQYESTGVLILVQASGGGDYWGEYDGVKVKVYIRASPVTYDGRQFLKLQQLKMDFSVKEISMGVTNVANGNTVLQAALNLFINSNGQELLKEMKPTLKKKLLILMKNFVDNLFQKIPYDSWIV